MEVAEQFDGEVRIIGIPGLAEQDAMREFIESTGTEGIVHILDPERELWDRFGVRRQRTYVLVNDDGTPTETGYGNLHGQVEDLVER